MFIYIYIYIYNIYIYVTFEVFTNVIMWYFLISGFDPFVSWNVFTTFRQDLTWHRQVMCMLSLFTFNINWHSMSLSRSFIVWRWRKLYRLTSWLVVWMSNVLIGEVGLLLCVVLFSKILYVEGKLRASSRLFSSPCFSISIASLSNRVLKCGMAAICFVSSKLIWCPVFWYIYIIWRFYGMMCNVVTFRHNFMWRFQKRSMVEAPEMSTRKKELHVRTSPNVLHEITEKPQLSYRKHKKNI